MVVLELGRYIVPAYAGMLLAEQGHCITKWTNSEDPIQELNQGAELWDWINHGKRLEARAFRDVEAGLSEGRFDAVIDNVRLSSWRKWGVDPAALAKRYGVRWVSMRGEVGEVSFDAIAQARALMRFAPWAPFYIGDTAGGLWLAFKLLAVPEPGHYVLGHSTCLAKLVEGELVVEVERDGSATPWDVDPYRCDADGAHVHYRGVDYHEPVRDARWQWDNLWHEGGRFRI